RGRLARPRGPGGGGGLGSPRPLARRGGGARGVGEPRLRADAVSRPMRRFFVRPDGVAAGRVRFDADETRHLRRVLRLGAGARIEATDGAGRSYVVRLLAVEADGAVGLIETEGARPGRLLVLVGPEGGFTGEEVALARGAGIRVVSLGPRTLRAESAGLVAVALCQHAFGDLG